MKLKKNVSKKKHTHYKASLRYRTLKFLQTAIDGNVYD